MKKFTTFFGLECKQKRFLRRERREFPSYSPPITIQSEKSHLQTRKETFAKNLTVLVPYLAQPASRTVRNKVVDQVILKHFTVLNLKKKSKVVKKFW